MAKKRDIGVSVKPVHRLQIDFILSNGSKLDINDYELQDIFGTSLQNEIIQNKYQDRNLFKEIWKLNGQKFLKLFNRRSPERAYPDYMRNILEVSLQSLFSSNKSIVQPWLTRLRCGEILVIYSARQLSSLRVYIKDLAAANWMTIFENSEDEYCWILTSLLKSEIPRLDGLINQKREKGIIAQIKGLEAYINRSAK
ncbi:MAG: hypothetical protein IH840_14180 [Candidatus Heimdallarchaeota archaeon]|nr:hypothetical protein [Candidatus Heimdallarchaeota archaeon]